MDALVRPLPSELTTPPVTNMYFVMGKRCLSEPRPLGNGDEGARFLEKGAGDTANLTVLLSCSIDICQFAGEIAQGLLRRKTIVIFPIIIQGGLQSILGRFEAL